MDIIKTEIKKYYTKQFLLEIYKFLETYGLDEDHHGIISNIDIASSVVEASFDISHINKIRYSDNLQKLKPRQIGNYFLEVMHDFVAPRWDKREFNHISFEFTIKYGNVVTNKYYYGENKLTQIVQKPEYFLPDQIAKANFYHYLFPTPGMFDGRRSGRSTRDTYFHLVNFLADPDKYYSRGKYEFKLGHKYEGSYFQQIFEYSELFIEIHEKYEISNKGQLLNVQIKDIAPDMFINQEGFAGILIEYLSNKKIIYKTI